MSKIHERFISQTTVEKKLNAPTKKRVTIKKVFKQIIITIYIVYSRKLARPNCANCEHRKTLNSVAEQKVQSSVLNLAQNQDLKTKHCFKKRTK